jgi:hypothetical protein
MNDTTITAGQPPSRLTLAQWLAWRADETARMEQELRALVAAMLERMSAGTVH